MAKKNDKALEALLKLALIPLLIPITILNAIFKHKKKRKMSDAAKERENTKKQRLKEAKLREKEKERQAALREEARNQATKAKLLRQKEADQRKKEKERQAALREEARIQAAKVKMQRQKEAELRKKEKERQATQNEETRIQMAYASLEERYGQAEKRYITVQRQLSHSKDTLDRITLCKEAVSLIPTLIDYNTRKKNLNGSTVDISTYCRDFYLLSKAYEDYSLLDYAIQTCNDAMEFGFSEIPEAGTFSERIDQLKAMKEG